MKILFTNLKAARLREWALVLRIEGRTQSKWSLMTHLISALLKGRIVNGKTWRKRVRTCHRCPVYDSVLKRCRPKNDSPLGCGCYVPFLALLSPGCWGCENLRHKIPGFGWGHE